MEASELRAVLGLDRLIHEPARLLMLSILAGADVVEFRFLEEVSGLSKGNLSSHMTKLEGAGLIEVEKGYRGRRPLTTLRITDAGRRGLSDYRARMAAVVEGIPSSPGDAV